MIFTIQKFLKSACTAPLRAPRNSDKSNVWFLIVIVRKVKKIKKKLVKEEVLTVRKENHGIFNISIWDKWKWLSAKSSFKQKIPIRVDQKKINSSLNEYFTWTCLKFWSIKKVFRELEASNCWARACLQNYQQ